MQATSQSKSLLQSAVAAVFDADSANFWLQKINPVWSINQALGKIVDKTISAHEMVSLKIRVNKHFSFGEAGQHHPVVITVNGRCYERTYSLTLLDSEHVLLTVKKVDQGIVSTWLNEVAQVGDIIEFGQPYGDMTISATDAPLILLAAGSGITPMYSLLKVMLSQSNQSKQDIYLMYWAKTESDLAFHSEFTALAEQYKNFRFEYYTTQSANADARLNIDHFAQIKHLNLATVYACGPAGFVATAEQLSQNKVQLFKGEAFSLSPLVSDEIGFVQITLTQSNKVVTIPKGQSILASLEQQNIKPTYGCRMGICNKCACNKSEGSTKNMVNGLENSEPGNLLKICVNSAQSDLTIDL